MNAQFDPQSHLTAAYEWIRKSRSPRTGAARALYTPLRGWAKSYPQATGCLIPTLLRVNSVTEGGGAALLARSFGEFLIDIQHPRGGWHAGTWPVKSTAPLSPLATAHVLEGLCALYEHEREERWLAAAVHAATWLAENVEPDGPAFYTQIAWPLLTAWRLCGETRLRDAAVAILDAALLRRTILGAFTGWGMGGSNAAFTQTIGFTLRGFIESAKILDAWPRYGKPAMVALRRLADDAIASNGRLPGAYDSDWNSDRTYTCLTGNSQIALCLLEAHRLGWNRRFVQAASGLVREVCRRQHRDHPIAGLCGAIPGSYPVWGRYLRGRYPIWAAKYLCDAIMALYAVEEAAVFRRVETMPAHRAIAFTTM